MIVVADSSPLIALCRIGKRSLLRDLFSSLVVPEAVWNEVVLDHPGKAGVEEIGSIPWIEVKAVFDTSLVSLTDC